MATIPTELSPASTPTPTTQRPGLWRRLRIFGWGLAAAPILLFASLMLFENSLVYLPSRYPTGEWQPIDLAFEDAWFTADDGTKLHGWYVPADAPRAYVLFAHGNAGHVAHRAQFLRNMQQRLNISVLAFDYRGYGRSEGRPNEPGVLADARAARAWLASHAGIPADQIVVMGESLGGAVAVDLASTDGARALVLENTFTSLPDVAAYHFPWLPVRTFMRGRLNSAEKITRYRGPLLQCHGDADTIVPFALGVQLYEAASGPKQLVVIAGGNHNDARSEQWWNALDEFFDRLPE